MMQQKRSKLIVKDHSGNVIQLLPETKIDMSLDANSQFPVSGAAFAEALGELESSIEDVNIVKVMTEEPTMQNTTDLENDSLIAWIQKDSWSITERIYNDGDYGQIPFCLYGIQDASITVDWGDGTVEEVTSANAIKNECPIHEYASAGDYVVTMKSDDFARLYMMVLFIEGNQCASTYLGTLISVNNSIPTIAGVRGQNSSNMWESYDNSFSSCFFYASELASIPSDLFSNNPNATDFSQCFAACRSLESIPEGLFDKNVAATDFSRCFSHCSLIESIPEELFNKNVAASSFAYCFSNCDSLQSIPSKLFKNNIAVEAFYGCFSNCTALGDFNAIIGSPNVSDASYFINKKTEATRTVSVPSSSISYTTFSNLASSLGITVAEISA